MWNEVISRWLVNSPDFDFTCLHTLRASFQICEESKTKVQDARFMNERNICRKNMENHWIWFLPCVHYTAYMLCKLPSGCKISTCKPSQFRTSKSDPVPIMCLNRLFKHMTTPPKTNMEPANHPFEKETRLSILVFHVRFQGSTSLVVLWSINISYHCHAISISTCQPF